MAANAWLMVVAVPAGAPFSAGVTNYFPIASGLVIDATSELLARLVCRETYTWAGLYVKVTANATTAASTVRSRKNTDNGAQSVSIGAGLTGTFTDDTNHDCLADGDTCNFQVVVGAGGALTMRSVASSLTSTATSPILVCSQVAGSSVVSGANTFTTIMGILGFDTTESFSQYTFRVAATLSNLRVYVSLNSVNGASTFRTRKNTANGAQSVSITAATTGAFEDTTNTDSVVSGDVVNCQMVTGGSSGTMSLTIVHVKSTSAGRQVSSNSNASSSSGGTVDRFSVIESEPRINTTETNVQIAARIPFTAKNLFVRILGNTRDGTWTIRMRKNTANANMVVSIGAGLTGVFEDTVNTDSYVATDLINFGHTTTGSTGNMTLGAIGFELANGVGTLLDCFPGGGMTGLQPPFMELMLA